MSMTYEQAQRARGNVRLSPGDYTGARYRQALRDKDDRLAAVAKTLNAVKEGPVEMVYITGSSVPYAIPREAYNALVRQATRPDDDEIIDYTGR
jgi:hypothetical protein